MKKIYLFIYLFIYLLLLIICLVSCNSDNEVFVQTASVDIEQNILNYEHFVAKCMSTRTKALEFPDCYGGAFFVGQQTVRCVCN